MIDLAISKVVCEDNEVLFNGECTSTQGMFFPPPPIFGSLSFTVSCVLTTVLVAMSAPMLAAVVPSAVSCLWSLAGILFLVSKGEKVSNWVRV
jgi:hypothetical protein